MDKEQQQQQAVNENEDIDEHADDGGAGEDVSLYEPDARKSVVVPGSDGTLSGTAFADWLDEDGNLLDEHKDNEVPEAKELGDVPSPEEVAEAVEAEQKAKKEQGQADEPPAQVEQTHDPQDA